MNDYSPRRFFALWAAGLVAVAVLMRVVGIATAPGAGGLNRYAIFVFIAVAIVGHAWQASLLFRPGWRFALWTALPLLGLLGPGNVRWIELQGIIAPLVETAALAGVRTRAWAWLLAGMGQVILGQLGSTLINNLANSVGSRIGGMSQIILPGALSGLWLLGELAAAIVLAWWMPPIASRTDPPLPRESKDA